MSHQPIFSSSPLAPSSRESNRPKKQPSVTPRRFNRFFNAQYSASTRSGRQLRDITQNGANRQHEGEAELGFEDIAYSPAKRQRLSHTTPSIESSPLSSPLARLPQCAERLEKHGPAVPRQVRTSRIWSMVAPDASSQRILRQQQASYYHDPRWSTARFYSTSTDCYPHSQGVPFCAAACNTNSLVAIGDEQGMLHLLDAAKDSKPGFDKAFMKISSHKNAIMDLSFSSDDSVLVTSSGDQTSEVLDMRSQTVLYVFRHHTSSVKQAKFQPGNDNIIATCSRDGSVAIWDTRSRPRPVLPAVETEMGADVDASLQSPDKTPILPHQDDTVGPISASRCLPSNLIPFAHQHPTSPYHPINPPLASVTSLVFLPEPRAHLLLTSSEASSVIKLWDIRGKYKPNFRHNTVSTPVASTPPLPTHQNYRHYGITSLTVGSDGARMYSVCRDNTVYVYSTNHLVLGSASEFSNTMIPRFSSKGGADGKDKPALGPLYGFRNSGFHAYSFYVRSSLRSALGSSQEELLAVGSSDGCPVLFPTDERMLKYNSRETPWRATRHDGFQRTETSPTRRGSAAWSLESSSPSGQADAIPIFKHGTPLIRGHAREVSSLTWTTDGELVSVSDDGTARCWRESDPDMARSLRTQGEREGRRWGCGWADVDADWDEEDG